MVNGAVSIAFRYPLNEMRSQSVIVGKVTTLHTGWSRTLMPVRARDFSVPQKRPDRLWGPPSLLFSDHWASFPQVKRPGHEVSHSPP
jgi:hypothetical protein